MEYSSAVEMFQPLELEQALHLLDVMTWFPDTGADRWEKVAEYVASNAFEGKPPAPETCQVVVQRVMAAGPQGEARTKGRWQGIPQAKWLYQVKYDLMNLLYQDDWFTFMNMGFAEPDFVFDERPPAQERIWQLAANLYTQVATQIDLAGRTVLEVGCGRGGGAALIAETLRPAQYTGLDYSPNNVAFCTRVHARPGLDFRQGDAEHLPFPDDSFDAVINIESAHCYPNVDAFFAEVNRVLRPGGYLLFADEWWTSERSELRAKMTAGELEVLNETDLTPGIIRALRYLNAKSSELLAELPDDARRAVYSRFFQERVCRQSAYSYTSGRFVFLSALARARVRDESIGRIG